MWLWAWCEDGPEDDRLAGELPPPLPPDAQGLKRLFDDAAGPIYTQFAYKPQYRLARQWMLDEICTTEDFDEFSVFARSGLA